MLFTVSQISPDVELVYANADKYISVYPPYHQKSDLIYQNVNISDWTVVGTRYRWSTTFYGITDDTVPVIQLVYSYDATQEQKNQQYAAFKVITQVETTTGKLSFYAPTCPPVNFRIRYRILDKLDLAISLNRGLVVGAGFSSEIEQVRAILSSYNPVSGNVQTLSAEIPAGTARTCGSMPAGYSSRLKKLERRIDDLQFSSGRSFKVVGYQDSLLSTPVTEEYATVSDIASDTWYGDCAIQSRAFNPGFTDASDMLKSQYITNLDISCLYTETVEDMSYMLADMSDLETVTGLELLDTRSATDISYMFSDDVSLLEVDLSTWITHSLTNIEGLFKGCVSLTRIDVSSFDFTNLISQPDIFTGIPNDCIIYVNGQAQYDLVHAAYPNLTGITYN